MKKTLTLLALSAVAVAIYSCNKKKDTLTTTAYLDLPATPYEYTNAGWDPRANYKATLGRVLFYDTRLSRNNAVSCGSCHKQALGFADNVALSTGFEGKLTTRNSIGINSTSLSGNLFWDGRENNIMNLSLRPISNHVEMGLDLDKLPAKLADAPYYSQLFIDAYGDESITTERVSTAIATFMTSIHSGNTRFDKYSRGQKEALTAEEIEGISLFDTKYNCGACHLGGGGGYAGSGIFTDIGLDDTYTDLGLGAVMRTPETQGVFKVPNLGNVAITGPYMHDGRYKTLGDVIDHYSRNIRRSPNLDAALRDSSGHAMVMDITEHDKKCIIAFMGTLTDYQMITDPKFSNPFKVK